MKSLTKITTDNAQACVGCQGCDAANAAQGQAGATLNRLAILLYGVPLAVLIAVVAWLDTLATAPLIQLGVLGGALAVTARLIAAQGVRIDRYLARSSPPVSD